jgi:arylsulfatase A-like enzyme
MSESRRHFLKQVAAGSTLPLLAAGQADAAGVACTTDNPGRRPLNLLLVFPDEMRAQAQQFMGMDPVSTPHIDKFARQACVMRQAVSNYPLCTPARAMVMTGQYSIRNGMTGNCHDFGALVGIDLSRHAICWSDVLKAKGYATGYIGKWHLDAPHAPYVQSHNNPPNGTKWNEWTPPERRHGFDHWYAYGTMDQHLTPMYWTNTSTRDTPIHIKQWGPIHEAEQAILYLRNEGGKLRDASKPFALVVSMNPPHSPYDQVPQKYLDLYAGRSPRELNPRANVVWDKKYEDSKGPSNAQAYFAMVTGVDEQFGRIMAALDEARLSDNTLVVFFSDHGCCLGAHGEPTKNNPFEESMRIPMMFRLPGAITPRSDDTLMSLPDLYPTVLGLLGLGQHIPATVEGSDLSARLLTGKGNTASSQLYLAIPYGGNAFGKRGVRTGQHTLVIERKDKQALRYSLYDNQRDPLQMTNIAAGNKALVQELVKRELEPWLERTGDPWRPAPFDSGGRVASLALNSGLANAGEE